MREKKDYDKIQQKVIQIIFVYRREVNMKKTLLCLIFCCTISLIGCGKSESKNQETVINTIKEENTNSVEDKDNDEDASESIIEATISQFENSSWSGVDAQGNMYLININKDQITYNVNGSDGEQVYEGSYSFSENGKIVLEDVTGLMDNLQLEFVLNGEESYFRINDVYLTKDLIDDYEERLKNLDLAAKVAEYMNSGHCWLTCINDKVILLFFDGQNIQMKYVEKTGDEIISEEINANWSMKLDNFAFYDLTGKKLEDFNWNFEDEGDLKTFTMTDSEDSEMIFYELEKESIEAGEELAEKYLENQQTMEEVEDLSTVLEGYEGVSIVDAFVAAGLNPEFSNRAVFAERMQIQNYTGTAEQNLSLLEALGGKIK